MTNLKPMMRPLIGALAGALALAAGEVPARATPIMASEPALHSAIDVPKDKTRAFRLEQPASRIVVAQADIAQVVATGDRSFYVRGKDIGTTNILVYGPGGQLREMIDVRVGYDPVELQDELATALPNEHIRVRSLGDGLLMTGQVSNVGVEERAKALAELFAPKAVTSALDAKATQVILEVRVMEADRSAVRDFGLSATVRNNSFVFSYGNGLIGTDAPNSTLSFTGGAGHTSIDAQIQALEAKGLVRTLARPNLVALSGEKASFLAGGEFPYPVPQGLNNVTIEFRQYGVRLNFMPVVEPDGLIRLKVTPEVSQIDQSNSLRLANITVPALTTRRADTTVELRSGESLAIGGLFQHQYSNGVSQVPGLGEIPILGSLFRSTRWQHNETELMIVVTPRLATAADIAAAGAAQLPGAEPRPADLLLKGKSLDVPMSNTNGKK